MEKYQGCIFTEGRPDEEKETKEQPTEHRSDASEETKSSNTLVLDFQLLELVRK